MANDFGGGASRPPRSFTPPPGGDYPAMKWHPETGEMRVYAKAEHVPEGWLDTHPANLAHVQALAAAAPKPVKLSLTRQEILAALHEGGIEHNIKAKTQDLHERLRERCVAHLTDAGVEFDAAADTKALLELIPKPE